jgi:glutamate receptor, ionotropic, invertebrate
VKRNFASKNLQHNFLFSSTSLTDTLSLLFFFFLFKGLLRLQQIYQGLNPGNETFRVEIVKRINNASEAIEFLQKIEQLNRWSRKYVVLDCPTEMAKEIVKSHVRDVSLGKRTYHYLLSGLVSLLLTLSFFISF